MKTFSEVRQEVLRDIEAETNASVKEVKYSFAQVEEMAAKAYAKMWVDRFAEKIEWIDENIGGDILDIKNEIDKQ